MISHRLLLYSVGACKWVLEDSKCGCFKSEYNEQYGYYAEYGDSRSRSFADGCSFVELSCFVQIAYCGRKKENSNIEPIG